MVLIFSEQSDASTSNVLEWLIQLDVPFYRINVENNQQVSIRLLMNSGEPELLLKDGEKEIRLHDISSVWFRRGSLPRLSKDYFAEIDIPPSFKERLQQHLSSEIEALNKYVYYLFRKMAINDPTAYAVNKLIVLDIARKYGLRTPATLITKDRKDVQAVADSWGALITKSIQDIATFHKEHYHIAQRTSWIERDSIEQLPAGFHYSPFSRRLSSGMRSERLPS